MALQRESENHPDLAHRASSETGRSIELRARDRQRKLIAKIDAALERLDYGTYGYCEETGEPIGLKGSMRGRSQLFQWRRRNATNGANAPTARPDAKLFWSCAIAVAFSGGAWFGYWQRTGFRPVFVELPLPVALERSRIGRIGRALLERANCHLP